MQIKGFNRPVNICAINGISLLCDFVVWTENIKMIPEIFHSPEVRHISDWAPLIGMVIIFLGMNMRVEVKIQKEEEENSEEPGDGIFMD